MPTAAENRKPPAIAAGGDGSGKASSAAPSRLHFARNQAPPRFGISIEEMSQRHEQLRSVPNTPVIECLVNIVNDHAANLLAAMGVRDEIVGQGRRRDFRNMFMLRDCSNLLLIETAKANAVFQ